MRSTPHILYIVIAHKLCMHEALAAEFVSSVATQTWANLYTQTVS